MFIYKRNNQTFFTNIWRIAVRRADILITNGKRMLDIEEV